LVGQSGAPCSNNWKHTVCIRLHLQTITAVNYSLNYTCKSNSNLNKGLLLRKVTDNSNASNNSSDDDYAGADGTVGRTQRRLVGRRFAVEGRNHRGHRRWRCFRVVAEPSQAHELHQRDFCDELTLKNNDSASISGFF